MIRIGDRVKLIDRVAKAQVPKHKNAKIDWAARRGSVVTIYKFADQVGVHWDDRRSADYWPTRALERLEAS